jgi:hypothetical protein
VPVTPSILTGYQDTERHPEYYQTLPTVQSQRFAVIARSDHQPATTTTTTTHHKHTQSSVPDPSQHDNHSSKPNRCVSSSSAVQTVPARPYPHTHTYASALPPKHAVPYKLAHRVEGSQRRSGLQGSVSGAGSVRGRRRERRGGTGRGGGWSCRGGRGRGRWKDRMDMGMDMVWGMGGGIGRRIGRGEVRRCGIWQRSIAVYNRRSE